LLGCRAAEQAADLAELVLGERGRCLGNRHAHCTAPAAAYGAGSSVIGAACCKGAIISRKGQHGTDNDQCWRVLIEARRCSTRGAQGRDRDKLLRRGCTADKGDRFVGRAASCDQPRRNGVRLAQRHVEHQATSV